MGTITKVQTKTRGWNYRAFIRRKGCKPVTRTFSTKRSAENWIREVEGKAELRRAFVKQAHKVTLADVIDAHLANWQGKSDPPTFALNWWKNKIGKFPAIEVTPDHVRDYLNEFARGKCERGHGKGRRVQMNRPRANSTINRAKAALSSAFSYGMENLGLPSNPCRDVKQRKEDNVRVRFLTDRERERLLEACRTSAWDKLHLIVVLAITTGARRGELLSLRWPDINFRDRTAILHDTKNGKKRVLTLPAPAIKALLPFREVGNGYVFPSLRKPGIAYDFKKPWSEALKSAQIDDFTFHDLRHTHASYLAQNGATLLEIAEALGHSQIQVTMRYAHLCIDSKQKLNDRVFGSM